jgi:hypothetical protein
LLRFEGHSKVDKQVGIYNANILYVMLFMLSLYLSPQLYTMEDQYKTNIIEIRMDFQSIYLIPFLCVLCAILLSCSYKV